MTRRIEGDPLTAYFVATDSAATGKHVPVPSLSLANSPISPMHTLLGSKKALLGIAAMVVAAVVLVACGGGTDPNPSADGRESALAAKPPAPLTIVWSPSALTYSVTPGAQQVVPAAFVPSREMEAITVSVSESLRSILQATSTSPAELDKGKAGSIRLTLAPAANASLGVVSGTIVVSSKKSGPGNPLPVTIIVATGAVGALPPDPGEAGKATLAGIDSDGDGVRDDVQRYIWLTYPQSEKARSALRQYSKTTQALLAQTGPADKDAASLIAALDCVGATFMASDDDVAGGDRVVEVTRSMKSAVLNTPDRVRAFAKSNSRFGGMTFSADAISEQAQRCMAPPSSFSN